MIKVNNQIMSAIVNGFYSLARVGSTGNNVFFTIYSGSMPTVDQNYIWTATAHAANQLAAGYTIGSNFVGTPYDGTPTGGKISLKPSATITCTVNKTGVPSWFVMSSSASNDGFFMGNVTSDPEDQAHMLIDIETITLGQPCVIVDLGFALQLI